MNRLVIVIAAFLLLIGPARVGMASDFSKAQVFDLPPDVAARQLGVVPGSGLTAEEMAELAAYRFDGDTMKVLIIPVEWENRQGTYSRETLDSLLLLRNVWPTGSLADYFDEVSYGQMAVVGTVVDWYNLGWYTGPDMWVFEDALYGLDGVVDYSQFDGNGDGVVDAVIFLRSGTGQEDSHDPMDVWSFAVSYGGGYGVGPFDGVMVSHWNTSPELQPLHYPAWPPDFTGADSLNSIRVFCHELSHNAGLPDLYDYDNKLDTTTYFTPGDYNDHPLMDWCLMGYGGYGIFSIKGQIANHLCGWSKRELGWVEPITLEGTYENLVLYNIETRADSSLYLLPIRMTQGEYFLLEYRNPLSTAKFGKIDSDYSVYFPNELDFGGDPFDRGLLITHVHDSVGGYGNNGTPSYPHYRVAVEDAGYNPAMDMYSNPEGNVTDSAQWWYPYETRLGAAFQPQVPGQNLFGPATVPSSDGYSGPTGIVVRVDSIAGDRIYLYVESPVQPDGDEDGIPDAEDNCLYAANPDQANADEDLFGDACDNCPNAANDDQVDADGDQLGDACDVCPADPLNDADGDAYCAGDDNCADVYNPDQADANLDGIGDACCCLLRGDLSLDGTVAVSDLTQLISFLFRSGPGSGCPSHGDVNGDGGLAVSDLTYLIGFLFRGGAAPPACI